MKRMALILIICSMVFSMIGTARMVQAEDATAAADGNLLINGGFETTESGASWHDQVKPTGWGQWLASGTPILAVDTDMNHSGNHSASIEGPDGITSRASISQSIPVEIGRTYRISGWVKTEAVSNKALIRFQMKRSGTFNVLINVGTLSGTNDWTYMDRLFTVPDNAADPVKLSVEMFLEAGTGKVWFDDIKVQETIQSISLTPNTAPLIVGETIQPEVTVAPESASTAGLVWSSSDPAVASVNETGLVTAVGEGQAIITVRTEEGDVSAEMVVYVGQQHVSSLLPNGGFEETAADSQWLDGVKPDKWGQWLASGTPILAVDSEIKHRGERSASIEGPEGTTSRAAITQAIPVEIGKTYRISGWVKTEAVSNNSLIRFQMKRIGTYNVLINIGTLKGTHDWTYMERLFTVPENAAMPATLKIEMFLEAGTGKVWFDDVKVEEPVQSISMEPDVAYLDIGGTLTPSVTFVPEGASNRNLIWTTSDADVASVTNEGVITGISEGAATITAETEDGGYTASITVSIGAPDSLSVEPYSGTTNEDEPLLGQLSAADANGDPVTFTLVTPPEHGMMNVQPGGSFTYYPTSNYSGSDTFKFIAQTSVGGPRFEKGTIMVAEINDSPVLDLEWAYTASSSPLSGTLKEATDADGDAIVWSAAGSPMHGAVQIQDDGNFTYTPSAGFFGYDKFRIAAEDSRGGRTEGNMHVFVGPDSAQAGERTAMVSHPGLLASESDLNASIALLANQDPYMTEWFALLKKQADAALETQPLAYSANGGNTYTLRDRLIPVSLMYRFTGDSRYAERVWQELEAMTYYPDWGGRTNNILALSELSYAVALSYDWIYDYMTDVQRKQINEAIRDKALSVALDWYRGEFRHNGEYNNINLVNNGGLGLLALAVVSEPETREASLEVVSSTFDKLQNAVRHYTEDGAWPEGPAYWHYGGQYLAMYVQGLNQVMGADFGLSELPGYEASGAYPYHLLGEGGFFNFYDGNLSYNLYESLWFAKFFDKPEYAWYVGDLYRRKGNFHPLYMVFYQPGMFDVKPAELDRFFSGIESGSMRSAWDDPYALFASMKGVDETLRSHTDMDGGTFVFDALGVRWAADLGNESYSLPGFWDSNYTRWTYYRKKTEGHNTIVLNPVDHPVLQQKRFGTAATVRNESKPRGAFTILDMTDLYSEEAVSMLRGMKLSAERTELVIQDEMDLKRPSELYWFMHTPADIQIIDDGRAALLRQQDKKLYVTLDEAPEGAVFSTMDAVPLPTSPNPDGQSSNEGIRKLVVHLQDVQNATLTIRMVPLYSTDPLPFAAKSYTPLADWSIPDGALPERQERVSVSDITLNGNPLPDFDPGLTYYEVETLFDEPVPPIVQAESEYEVMINQAADLPGTATVTVRDAENPTRINAYTIVFSRGAAAGEPPQHLKYPVAEVTASAVPEAANIPEHTIDGSLGTRWSASGIEYLQLDLGEAREVGAVSLAYYLGDTRQSYFDILASNDGAEWTAIYENGVTSGSTSQPETFYVEETTARYIRVLGKGNSSNSWNSITEVGVYPTAPLVMRVDAPTELKLNENYQVTAAYGFPQGRRTSATELTYTTDQPDVLQVDGEGMITGKSPGTATLSVTDEVYGFVVTVNLHVPFNGDDPFLRIRGDNQMESKETQQLMVERLYPDGQLDAPDKLSYRSSQPEIVSVDANGIVRANLQGTAVITITDRTYDIVNTFLITVE